MKFFLPLSSAEYFYQLILMFPSIANMTKKEEIARDFGPCRLKKPSNREGETIVQRNTWQREKKKKEIRRDRN